MPAPDTRDRTLVVLVVCVVVLFGAFLFKNQCTAPEGWDGRQYSHLCYNDIQPLYSIRGLHVDQFPYVAGTLQDQELLNGAIEYPVLTGLFMWAAGLLVDDVNSYFRVTAVLLAPFALVTGYLLARMAGIRALMWAAAPAIVLYAFHNWDLLAVAATVAGIWFWRRERDVGAAVMFGIGGALKMFPAFLLAPLFLYVVRKRGWGPAFWVGIAGVATVVAINVPFAARNLEGWLATYEFHSLRLGNFDSIWNLGFPTLSPERLNLVTGVLTAIGFAAALGIGWWRSKEEGIYPFLQVSAALVATFMLFGKVHSPQYTLWILPFFVLTYVSVGWWIAYAVVDLAVYVGVFRWFYDVSYRGQDFTFFKKLMIGGVWGRALLLAVLYAVFLWARPAPGADPDPSRERAPRLSDDPDGRQAVGERVPVAGPA